MIITSTMVATGARIISPVLLAASKSATKSIQNCFINWSNTNNQTEIAKHLLSVGIVKTIWSAGRDIFIKEFYYPSRLDKGAVIKDINDLPPGNLVIEGIVGQGKSIFMRHLACTAISDEATSAIPIFIELQKINKKRTIKRAIAETLELLGVSVTPASVKHLSSNAYIMLLLDGFDEVPENYVQAAILELETLQQKYPLMKIVVSSRPGSDIQQLVGFSVHRLTPLSSKDYTQFLTKLNLDTLKKANLLAAIKSSTDAIKETISTPLMLTLVVWVYESEQDIPATLKEFFEKLFHVVFTRHDSLKAGFSRQHYSGLSETKLQKLFEAFCFMAVQNGYGRSLTGQQFIAAFQQAAEYSEGCECELENFRKDIVKVACLMLEDGVDLTTFLHKSILDYFSAAFILHNDDELSEIFYNEAYSNFNQWQATLGFLSETDIYRYSKNYVLKHLPAELDRLTIALADMKDDTLERYLLNEIGNFTCSVNSAGRLRTWDPGIHAESEFGSNLQRAVILTCLDLFNNQRPALDLKNLIEDFVEYEENADLTLHQTNFIKICRWTDLSLFRLKLSRFEDDTSRRIQNAQTIVSMQVRKKQIFGKKPKN